MRRARRRADLGALVAYQRSLMPLATK